MYMDNNPLAYVKESKLGVGQMRWLSKLVLFDFDIKYRKDKLNKAADTLSHCPYVPGEMDSDSESEEYKSISCTTVCEEQEEIINEEKLPIECKVAIQNKENKLAKQELAVHSSVIEALSRVSSSEMEEAQQADPTSSQIVP